MSYSESDIINSYYEAVQPDGALPLNLAVEIISQRIMSQHNPSAEVREIVRQAFLESPSAEDLREDAVQVIAEALSRGVTVVIWTVGDKGAYTSEERHTTYRQDDFQNIKIQKSNLRERIASWLSRHGCSPEIMDSQFFIDINSSHKENSFVNRLKQGSFKRALVVDDQSKNINNARSAASKNFLSTTIEDWHINHEKESEGGFSAFARSFLRDYLSSNDPSTLICFFDFDDTIYNTGAQLWRAAEKAKNRLKQAGFVS